MMPKGIIPKLKSDPIGALHLLRGYAAAIEPHLSPAVDDLLIRADERVLIERHLADIYYGGKDGMLSALAGIADAGEQAREQLRSCMEQYAAQPCICGLADVLSAALQTPFTQQELRTVTRFAEKEVPRFGIS